MTLPTLSSAADSASHSRSLVVTTAPERPTKYYFRNLEEDMDLVSSGLAGHQKEGMPPKTLSVHLEDAVDSLGMSSSFSEADDDFGSTSTNSRSCTLLSERGNGDDDDEDDDDNSNDRHMTNARGEVDDHFGRNDWRRRSRMSRMMDGNGSGSSTSEQSSDVEEVHHHHHTRGFRILDRSHFLVD